MNSSTVVQIHGSPGFSMSDSVQRLVSWALAEHEKLRIAPPTRLHSQGNREDEAVTVSRETIRGLPFSKSFERYLDGATVRTPARRALEKMHAHSRKQSEEYRIAHALIVRGDFSAIAGFHPSVVLRSLSTLRTLADQV